MLVQIVSAEEEAVRYLERVRWGDAPACPRCDSFNVYQMRNRRFPQVRSKHYRWRCRACRRQFSVFTGSPLENCRVGAERICIALNPKRRRTALQIQRELGISYKSALYLKRRLEKSVQ